MSTSKAARIRRDGWTPERQLRFLDALARTRSVTRAAAFAGMSRESAYRLRARRDGALFAAAWDRALERPAVRLSKGHKRVSPVTLARSRRCPESRENPPKVTKWKKCTDPRFQAVPSETL